LLNDNYLAAEVVSTATGAVVSATAVVSTGAVTGAVVSAAGVVSSVLAVSLQATKDAAMNAIAKNFFILLFF
jgi:glycine/D-amino acid oxidase-like deaminating enzyme